MCLVWMTKNWTNMALLQSILTPIRTARSKTVGAYSAQLRWLLAPYLIGTLVLVGLPEVMSLALAFTRYDGLSSPEWVGLQVFREVMAERLFWTALRNSLFFVILAVPLRIGMALAMAMLLQHRRRGTGVYRASVYLPTVIPDVAFALIWLWIFNPLYGPLNLVLGALGLPTPAWFVDPGTAKLIFVVMFMFQIGEGFVVLLAGLHNIPQELYDAAAVDGGSMWQVMRYITLPLLVPWLLLLTVRDIIMSFQIVFTPSLIMTHGGPYYATLFLPLLIFEEAFDRLRFGQGSAMMFLMLLTTLILIVGVFALFKGKGYVNEYDV